MLVHSQCAVGALRYRAFASEVVREACRTHALCGVKLVTNTASSGDIATGMAICSSRWCMKQCSLDEVELVHLSEDASLWSLREPLGANDVAINRFQLAPRSRVPWGLHAHYDQEELFIVIDGTLTFETLNGERSLGTDEAIRFAPGEFQTAKNETGETVTYLAIGAPAGSDDIRIPLPCPTCDNHELQLDMNDDGLRCLACGESVPAECQVCGEDACEVRLGSMAGELVDYCRNCGRTESIRS